MGQGEERMRHKYLVLVRDENGVLDDHLFVSSKRKLSGNEIKGLLEDVVDFYGRGKFMVVKIIKEAQVW